MPNGTGELSPMHGPLQLPPKEEPAPTFDAWVLLELMGHRRLAGRLTEQRIGGATFLRIDVPAVDGQPEATQFYAPGAVYCVTPVDEETARKAAANFRPEPIRRWELPALPATDDPIDPDLPPF